MYRYDGTYPGFLCCVAECFHDKTMPQGIQCLDEPQETLFSIKAIDTDPDLARRVEESVVRKASPQAADMLRKAFLTCMEEKEMRMLRFVLLGYKHGPQVTKLAANDDVHAVNRALLYLKNEAHYHVEFLRFSDLGGVLVSEITPNNNVLPLIAGHFCDRFSGENLMIYDKTHKLGFYHKSTGRSEFFEADSVDLPPPDEEEEKYRALWRRFYEAITIEGRKNPGLRMNLMPKRYWPNMTEFQAL